MIKQIKNQILQRVDKKPILYDYYYKQDSTPKPVVIFCHGYKGFKDWGAWDLVASKFAEAGFFFVKFNFSHNGGTPQQPIDFPDLEAFAQNNFTKELDDLAAIIDLVETQNTFSSEIKAHTINLIGHSRGGGIVLIKAKEDSRIKKVVTWAGVSDFKSRFQTGTPMFNHWKETGVFYVENARTKQQLPHYFQFFEDFIKNENRLTIKQAVSSLQKPYLIVHGTNDTTVTLEEAKQLNKWSSNSKLAIIKDANHVFGAQHPWKEKTLPGELQEVIRETVNFLK
jgi:pimeloyl-ACP methyl ester carboxylesterase